MMIHRGKMAILMMALRDEREKACRNEQSAALLPEYGFGHIHQYAPVSLILSALHLTHYFTPIEAAPKSVILTQPL